MIITRMIKATRSVNYLNAEKILLVQIIANKYADIVENKKIDKLSTSLKESAWRDIEKEFNKCSTLNIYRTASSLKKCYENRKKYLRKRLAEKKKEVMTDRSALSEIKTDKVDEVLLSVMNTKTILGLENKVENISDGTLMESNISDNEIEYIIQRDIETDEELLTNSSTLKIEEEMHADQMAILKSPIVTSDVLQKKYELLLDKRLELLNKQIAHLDVENALLIRKRQLEVELLENELGSKKEKRNTLFKYSF